MPTQQETACAPAEDSDSPACPPMAPPVPCCWELNSPEKYPMARVLPQTVLAPGLTSVSSRLKSHTFPPDCHLWCRQMYIICQNNLPISSRVQKLFRSFGLLVNSSIVTWVHSGFKGKETKRNVKKPQGRVTLFCVTKDRFVHIINIIIATITCPSQQFKLT